MTLRKSFEEREADRAYRERRRQERQASARPKIDKDVKLGGPEVVIPPRPKVSPAVRARVIAKTDGCCARLGCAVSAGLEVDHIIPRELGGSDGETNLEALCGPHHKAKTARDIKLIAKARRIRVKLTKPREPSRLQSRGFDDGYSPFPPSRGFRS